MARPGADAYAGDFSDPARWLFALGAPNRLALVRALAGGEKTVGQLAAVIGVEMPNVSQHLQVLKAAGLVAYQKDGAYSRYRLVGATVNGTVLELEHASGVTVSLPLR